MSLSAADKRFKLFAGQGVIAVVKEDLERFDAVCMATALHALASQHATTAQYAAIFERPPVPQLMSMIGVYFSFLTDKHTANSCEQTPQAGRMMKPVVNMRKRVHVGRVEPWGFHIPQPGKLPLGSGKDEPQPRADFPGCHGGRSWQKAGRLQCAESGVPAAEAI